MFSKKFLKFLEDQDAYIAKFHGSPNKKMHLLAQTVKLSEETGEVSDAVLAFLGYQRKEKTREKTKELGGELSDVIITACLVGKTAGIDMEKALEEKIRKIGQRRKSE